MLDADRYRRRLVRFLELLRQSNQRVCPPVRWFHDRSRCAIRGEHVEFESRFSPLTLPAYARDGVYVPPRLGVEAIETFDLGDIAQHLYDACELWPWSATGEAICSVLGCPSWELSDGWPYE